MKKNSIIWYTVIFGLALISLAACSQASPIPSKTPENNATPAVTATAAEATLKPGGSQRTLRINGQERTYLLHIPSGLRSSQPAALVFVFHGYSESAGSMEQDSGMNDVADKNKFLVVYPNGSGPDNALSWNADACCGYAVANHIDEAAFIHQMIADLGTIAKIDIKRVYAAGFSNGGLLSYKLGCEMSDTFAAIAPVSGALVTSPCQPSRPVPVIHIHGLNDSLVPFAGGGAIPITGKPFPAVAESIAAWVKLDGCPPAAKTEQNELFEHSSYGPCKNGSTVEMYAVKNSEHNWPTHYALPASQIIWDFFAAHPKP